MTLVHGLPVGMEKRIRGLMDDHENLRGALITDETEKGYYALVIRDWEHPDPNVDADILSERFAYLTKGGGNDGWISDGDAVAINRRDSSDAGKLAGSLAAMYARVAEQQRGDSDSPSFGSAVDLEE